MPAELMQGAPLPQRHLGPPPVDKGTRLTILGLQRNECTEKLVYERLANSAVEPSNAQVLARIAREEESHYQFWKRFTGEETRPRRLEVWLYVAASRLLGLTFVLKLMEWQERRSSRHYEKLVDLVPEAKRVLEDEERHEQELINLVDDERLRYLGSVVLGLNDALVELTGVLAGLTFAFQNARLVAGAGFITGIAAALSMAASEYLSIKSEGGGQGPLKASMYTGTAYVLTVIFLVAPYLFLSNLYVCIVVVLANALIVISLFSFYVAVAKDLSFKRRFMEMTLLGLGVSTVTFLLGALVRTWLALEV